MSCAAPLRRAKWTVLSRTTLTLCQPWNCSFAARSSHSRLTRCSTSAMTDLGIVVRVRIISPQPGWADGRRVPGPSEVVRQILQSLLDGHVPVADARVRVVGEAPRRDGARLDQERHGLLRRAWDAVE